MDKKKPQKHSGAFYKKMKRRKIEEEHKMADSMTIFLKTGSNKKTNQGANTQSQNTNCYRPTTPPSESTTISVNDVQLLKSVSPAKSPLAESVPIAPVNEEQTTEILSNLSVMPSSPAHTSPTPPNSCYRPTTTASELSIISVNEVQLLNSASPAKSPLAESVAKALVNDEQPPETLSKLSVLPISPTHTSSTPPNSCYRPTTTSSELSIISVNEAQLLNSASSAKSLLAESVAKAPVNDEQPPETLSNLSVLPSSPAHTSSTPLNSSYSQTSSLSSPTSSSTFSQPDEPPSSSQIDIGCYIGKQMDEETKYHIITNPWKPDHLYSPPFSTQIKNGKQHKRYFNMTFLRKYEWLVLSGKENGLFCKYCAVFASQVVVKGGENIQLGKFVNRPVKTFGKLTGTVKEVVGFFRQSAKRMSLLKKICGKRLTLLCETRWTEKIEAISDFESKLVQICQCLKKISGWGDSSSSSKANNLLSALTNIEFIVALQCQVNIMELFVSVTKLLQSKQLDLSTAQCHINKLKCRLKKLRTDADMSFNSVFDDVERHCLELDVVVRVPRYTSVQKNRPNMTSTSPRDFYKKSIYIPMLDCIQVDLDNRFNEGLFEFLNFDVLMPSNLINLDISNTKNIEKFDKISTILSKITGEEGKTIKRMLISEVQLYLDMQSCSTTAVPNDLFNEQLFPYINKCLKIYISMPVSIASAERSFSTLKRLKSYLRSSMTQSRLCGLAMLNVHREIQLNLDNIIDLFANKNKRKLLFKL